MVAVDPSRSSPAIWYKGATLFKPNRLESHIIVESMGYFKERNLETIAKILVDKLQLEKVIITLGDEFADFINKQADTDACKRSRKRKYPFI